MLVDPSRPLSFDDDEDNKDADKVAQSPAGCAKSNNAALSIVGRKTASVAELERAEIAADAAANRAMRRRQDVRYARAVMCEIFLDIIILSGIYRYHRVSQNMIDRKPFLFRALTFDSCFCISMLPPASLSSCLRPSSLCARSTWTRCSNRRRSICPTCGRGSRSVPQRLCPH